MQPKPIPETARQEDRPVRDSGIRSTGANEPIVLHGMDEVLQVVHGHIDVFAIRMEDGSPRGERFPIYRARPGDLIMGLPVLNDTTEALFALVAVGTLGSRIRQDVDLYALPPSEIAERLDRMTADLLQGMEQERPQLQGLVVDPGCPATARRGTALFAATRQPVWVETTEPGGLLLHGLPQGAASRLPVTASDWVVADTALDVTVSEMRDLVTQARWVPALADFLTAYARTLPHVLKLAGDAARQRQGRIIAADAASLDHSIRNLASLLEPGDGAATGIDVGGDGLNAAFLAILQAIGEDLSAAPRLPPARPGIEALENLALSHRVRTRKVLLRGRWWQQENQPLLAYWAESGKAVALIPKSGGYVLFDGETGRRMPIDKSVAESLTPEAEMIYRPLPAMVRSLSELLAFVLPLLRQDFKRVAAMGLCGGAIAALTPILTGLLFESVLPRADMASHVQIILALVVAGLGAASFEAVKIAALLRVEGKSDLVLQSALFDRLLRLPTQFYRRFTTGDMSDRVLGIQTIRQTLTSTTLRGLLGAVFSSFSMLLLLYYNWRLAFLAIAILTVAALFIGAIGYRQLQEERARLLQQGRAEGFLLQLISAIGKLRVAGAEKRAYAKWADFYADQKRRFFKAQSFANLQDVFQAMFPVLATAVIFALASVLLEDAVRQQQLDTLTAAIGEKPDGIMSTGDFVAFNAAFGQLLVSMASLVTALTQALVTVPMFERLRPLVEEPLEEPTRAQSTIRLRGAIELNNVRFRYTAHSAPVLDNLSLSIQANEYIAVVGPSGSGKSTLVRVLLGFEQCEAGEVLFDGVPIHGLELASLRRQMQTVLQNGRLTGGSIFSNVAGNSTLTEEDVWRAIRLAGLEADIEAMPMGLHSVVTEGVNTLSGGQRQRLLIARALAQRPAVLVLDEPTSALDNTTQDLVMNALAHTTGTRIVIAHRLSTVRHVDRILVMDQGKLVQQGRFDELLSQDGLFAEIARRQMI